MTDEPSKKIPLADPLIGEEEAKAVYDVVKSGWIREGKLVKKFEDIFAKYLGAKHAIATSSGTTALHAAMLALGIKKGDEVIVPSLTCVPPVSAALLCGAVPVFVDIETETYNIDPEEVRAALSDKTKVIVPINYAGHPAKLKELEEIANENDIVLLNDAAEALEAKIGNRNVGGFGKVSIYSFSPNKTITTGEGGMVTTDDDELADKVRIVKDYGQKGRFNFVDLGNNYHFTEMQAAIGIEQMKKVDGLVKRKRAAAKLMTEKLDGIKQLQLPVEKKGYTHVYMLYTVRIINDSREDVIKKLESAGIQSRVYFPPLHKSELLKRFESRVGSVKNTEKIADSILSLPSSAKLTEEQIDYISKTMKEIFGH
jgi:perosamine synthetase